jgi:hypothetical protein
MNISTEELIAVLPQATERCRMELTNLVLQARLAQAEAQIAEKDKAIACLEQAVKGTT